MASPVSIRGWEFLRQITEDEETGIAVILAPPGEFSQHVPEGINIVFLKEDGKVMPIGANQGLQ